jgi:chemotaxis protein histidine kinase CheA
MMSDSGTEIDDEFLDIFLDESFEVLENLKRFMEDFRDVSQVGCFEQFGQQVDRIMGAAYTLSLNQIGDLAKLGKELGYKSSQIQDPGKLLSIQSLLSQLVRAIETMLRSFRKRQVPDTSELPHLKEKLSRASAELGNLRTSVKD